MQANQYFFTKKISPFLGVIIIVIFTFVITGVILVQVKKLNELEKPLPLFINPYNYNN